MRGRDVRLDLLVGTWEDGFAPSQGWLGVSDHTWALLSRGALVFGGNVLRLRFNAQQNLRVLDIAA